MTTDKKDVIQRLSALQGELAKQGIAKAQQNQQQRYNYRGIDDVMNAVAPLLARYSLLIIPNVLEHTVEKGTTKSGSTNYHHSVVVEYSIIGPEGDYLGPFKSRGECIDTSDKGLNKACTAAYKYWVLTTLCVPIEGHDDADATTPEAAATAELMSDDQRHEILGMCMQTGTNVDKFLEYLGYEKLVDVPKSMYETAVNALSKKMRMQAGSTGRNRDYEEGEVESARSDGRAALEAKGARS